MAIPDDIFTEHDVDPDTLAHLGPLRRSGLTQTVEAWREIAAGTSARGGPEILPLPHPSWRNNAWLKRHPWFESELLVYLRHRIAQQLGA